MELTQEERAELTPFHMLAIAVLRETSDAIQPCWLCLSEEAKQEARQKVVEWFNGQQPHLGMNEQDLAEYAEQAFGYSVQYKTWVEAETELKRLREEDHNPQAFFATYQG